MVRGHQEQSRGAERMYVGGSGEEKGVSGFLLAQRLEERGVKRKLQEPEDRAHLFLGGQRPKQVSGRQSAAWDVRHSGAPSSVQLGS